MGIIANYKFTNKKHPWSAIFSVLLGCMSIISIILAIYFTYLAGGEAAFRYGIVCLLAVLISIVGEAMAIVAFYDKDRFYFFPVLGMILNAIVFIAGLYIVFAGVNGV